MAIHIMYADRPQRTIPYARLHSCGGALPFVRARFRAAARVIGERRGVCGTRIDGGTSRPISSPGTLLL
ncbi:hypothetical protein [Catellatospora methionotrophica]|uniref:hypothetical protein n=1 Tax=Catellatospora methionotrophica TaxID=121620 RepID=UPI0033EB7940